MSLLLSLYITRALLWSAVQQNDQIICQASAVLGFPARGYLILGMQHIPGVHVCSFTV